MLCPICRQNDTGPDPDFSGTWEWGNRTFHLETCRSCGSAMTFPLPDNDLLNNIYKNQFNFRWYKNHYSAKLKDARARAIEYQPFLGESVLDYGGGFGYMSRAISELGLTSATYDPYTTSEINVGERNWDTVVSLHALEHSNSPDRTIDDISRKLKRNGNLILAVPNFNGEGYKKEKTCWVWAQPPFVHIFHFTKNGLVQMLARHGFKVVSVGYKDRWDANLLSDVLEVSRFRKLDADWGRRYIKIIPGYNYLVAQRNSLIRFKALKQAKNLRPSNDPGLSELEIIAKRL